MECPPASIDQSVIRIFSEVENEYYSMDHLRSHRWMDCKHYYGTKCTNGSSCEHRRRCRWRANRRLHYEPLRCPRCDWLQSDESHRCHFGRGRPAFPGRLSTPNLTG